MSATQEEAPERRTIGPTLRALLAQRGMHEADLAARVGVSPNSVSSWATGRFAPSYKNAERIATELKVSLDELHGDPPGSEAPDYTADAEGLVKQLAQLRDAEGALRDLSRAVPPLLEILSQAQRLAEAWNG